MEGEEEIKEIAEEENKAKRPIISLNSTFVGYDAGVEGGGARTECDDFTSSCRGRRLVRV